MAIPSSVEPANHSGTAGKQSWRATIAPAAVTAIAIVLLLTMWTSEIPLGIAGQWAWHASPRPPETFRFLFPAAAFAGYLAFAYGGQTILRHHREWWIILLLPTLLVAGAIVQWTCVNLPAPPLGIERWPLSLSEQSTSGYFSVARDGPRVRKLLAEYEDWIARQDVYHIGTHPPGLVWLNALLLERFREDSAVRKTLLQWIPDRFEQGMSIRSPHQRFGRAEQATLFAMSLLTFAAGVLTLVPIYAVARTGASPSSSWIAASLWPLVPGPVVFLPVSDCLFPLLAVTTIALVLWSSQWRLEALSLLAGIVLCIGLMFSLALLAIVPLVVGSAIARSFQLPSLSASRICWHLVAFFGGFILTCEYCWSETGINLLAVWNVNLEKHAGFYDANPRSYWPWIVVNLVEFAIATGPAVFLLGVLAAFEPSLWRRTGRLGGLQACWLLTLVVLDLSGRNLSEVARLWILLMPFACVGAAGVADAADPGRWVLGGWFGSQILMTWTLIVVVEPLLPIMIP